MSGAKKWEQPHLTSTGFVLRLSARNALSLKIKILIAFVFNLLSFAVYSYYYFQHELRYAVHSVSVVSINRELTTS